MLKGGFVIGVRHGNGVVVLRDDAGNWRPPSFISITGGSIGWQAGVQSTDVVLVFKTKNSINRFASGKFTIGGDVSAAAGPVGREASAATDITLKSEIYSYSRSRGLFAGAAIDGSSISLDNEETAAYYRGTGILQPDGPPGQPPMLPPSAAQLLETIAAYSKPEAAPGTAVASGTGGRAWSGGSEWSRADAIVAACFATVPNQCYTERRFASHPRPTRRFIHQVVGRLSIHRGSAIWRCRKKCIPAIAAGGAIDYHGRGSLQHRCQRSEVPVVGASGRSFSRRSVC